MQFISGTLGVERCNREAVQQRQFCLHLRPPRFSLLDRDEQGLEPAAGRDGRGEPGQLRFDQPDFFLKQHTPRIRLLAWGMELRECLLDGLGDDLWLEDVLLDLRKDRLIHGCHGQEHRHGTALCLPVLPGIIIGLSVPTPSNY